MNEFEWMLFGCVVVLALAGSYATGQNRVLVGVVQMWKRRCEDRAARIASLEQTVAWLQSELGATEDESQEVER